MWPKPSGSELPVCTWKASSFSVPWLCVSSSTGCHSVLTAARASADSGSAIASLCAGVKLAKK